MIEKTQLSIAGKTNFDPVTIPGYLGDTNSYIPTQSVTQLPSYQTNTTNLEKPSYQHDRQSSLDTTSTRTGFKPGLPTSKHDAYKTNSSYDLNQAKTSNTMFNKFVEDEMKSYYSKKSQSKTSLDHMKTSYDNNLNSQAAAKSSFKPLETSFEDNDYGRSSVMSNKSEISDNINKKDKVKSDSNNWGTAVNSTADSNLAAVHDTADGKIISEQNGRNNER